MLCDANGTPLRFLLSDGQASGISYDWGLAPFTAEQRRDMLELLDDRYGQHSTLATSQMPVDKWHELIGEATHRFCFGESLFRRETVRRAPSESSQ